MKFNIMKENPMENLEGICSRIGLQEEVREKISEIEQKSELSWAEKEIPALTEEKNWKKAREELKKNLGEDPNGMKMLFLAPQPCFKGPSGRGFQNTGLPGYVPDRRSLSRL